jgi:hypothetical protein
VPDVRLTAFELARLDEARRHAAALEASLRAEQRGAAVALARRPARWLWLGGAVVVLGAVAGAIRLAAGPAAPVGAPVASVGGAGAALHARTAAGPAPLPAIDARHASFGKSGDVRLRLAMPGQVVDFPLAATAAPGVFAYTWVRAADSSEASAPRALAGSVVLAPTQPGIYRLVVARRTPGQTGAAERRVLDDVWVAVLRPFAEKVSGVLNGYVIGRYPLERWGGERPQGFIEVTPATRDLRLTPHLRLADFLTHDAQPQWPRYVAVNPLLLDKLELVTAEIAKLRGLRDDDVLRVDVHSGFRTPSHNSGVEGSAFSSRHQYGDAADVAIDADGDGRFTSFDSRLVALAAEMVERRHPELVGGLGLYLNARSPTCTWTRAGGGPAGGADGGRPSTRWHPTWPATYYPAHPRPAHVMTTHIRERINRKLDALGEDRLYQILDYVEFLESRYAQRAATPPNAFQKFADTMEDRLRTGGVAASTVSEAMGFLNRAVGVLNGVAAAGRSVATDLASAAQKAVDVTAAAGQPGAPGAPAGAAAPPAAPPTAPPTAPPAGGPNGGGTGGAGGGVA